MLKRRRMNLREGKDAEIRAIIGVFHDSGLLDDLDKIGDMIGIDIDYNPNPSKKEQYDVAKKIWRAGIGAGALDSMIEDGALDSDNEEY